MSDIAIRVESLGKAYRIGLKEQQHETLLGAMAAWVKSPLRNFREVRNLSRFDDAQTDHGPRTTDQGTETTDYRPRTTDHGPQEQKSVVRGQLSVVSSDAAKSVVSSQLSGGPPLDIIWALRDVSFEVKHGEAIGIIGRNGAGKSTLLKILSRITEPTAGRAEIYGRVGSLLEVGTGFHPDLTGRENVYLNGTILGMKKREVDAKFDQIVDFSGVEKFIDTPVKRYSSGMRVRLAFSVAAHLEPEILIIDEVLAVGDGEFQKRCLKKMNDVAHQGRTVLFVSHNLAAVRQLCSRCCVLESGSLTFDGATEEALNRYLRSSEDGNLSGVIIPERIGKPKPGSLGEIVKIEVKDQSGRKTALIGIGEPFEVRLHTRIDGPLSAVSVGVEVKSLGGVHLVNLRSDAQQIPFGPYSTGDLVAFVLTIPGLALYPGQYRLAPWVAEKDGKRIHHVEEGVELTLESKGKYASERMIQDGRGLIIMDCAWEDEVERA